MEVGLGWTHAGLAGARAEAGDLCWMPFVQYGKHRPEGGTPLRGWEVGPGSTKLGVALELPGFSQLGVYGRSWA
jgi:hypothetical protein